MITVGKLNQDGTSLKTCKQCKYETTNASTMLSHLNQHEIENNPVSRVYAEAMERMREQ